jgi:hypothetical protein
MTTAKLFPIMIGWEGTKGPCPSSIPWDAIAPYEGQAKVNHDQTLERLAERGGLDPVEAFFVLTGRTWRGVAVPIADALEKEACAFLDKIVKGPLRVERDALLLQKRELEEAVLKLSVKYQQHNLPLPPAMIDAWAAINQVLAKNPPGYVTDIIRAAVPYTKDPGPAEKRNPEPRNLADTHRAGDDDEKNPERCGCCGGELPHPPGHDCT